MKFNVYTPCIRLQPYIKQYVVSENAAGSTYKVFPSTSMVIGFQYSGRLAIIQNSAVNNLSTAGITGLGDSCRTFTNMAATGSVLIYFTEVGLAYFTNCPANELFNQSVGLENIFNKKEIQETEDKLAFAGNHMQRVYAVEQFLLSQLKNIAADKLVAEAIKLIYQSKGTIRIADLNKKLYTSQTPLEKRFRKLVGATPKKFASVVRFKAVLDTISIAKSLTDICYENNFFDQAHFIKDFKQYTGETPESFKRLM